MISMIEDDVLKRINELLEFNHWSLYKLAKKSDLPYSSLNNLIHRKNCPTIATLERICTGFGISLPEFFNFTENPLRNNDISTEKQDILNSYDSLSSKDKELLIAYLRGLCKK